MNPNTLTNDSFDPDPMGHRRLTNRILSEALILYAKEKGLDFGMDPFEPQLHTKAGDPILCLIIDSDVIEISAYPENAPESVWERSA